MEESFHTFECEGSWLGFAHREEGRDTAGSERDSQEKWHCPVMESGHKFPGAFSGASSALVEPREHRMQDGLTVIGFICLGIGGRSLAMGAEVGKTLSPLSPTNANKCNFLLRFGERVGC